MIRKYCVFMLAISCILSSIQAMCGNSSPEKLEQQEQQVTASVIPITKKPLAILNESDALGRTPLHYAAYYGTPEIVEMLLKKGALVNAKEICSNQTPLSLACDNHPEFNPAVIPVLIRYGANLETRDTATHTPFLRAARYSTESMVKQLLESGASLNARCIDKGKENHFTALHLAAMNRDNPAVLEYLLSVYEKEQEKNEETLK